MKLHWDNLPKKLKIGAIAAALLLLACGIFAWTQYGEYDTRDLPSKLTIIAKAKDGNHVHVSTGFDPTNAIPFFCYNPISGDMKSGSRFEEKNALDIEGSATFSLKKNFPASANMNGMKFISHATRLC